MGEHSTHKTNVGYWKEQLRGFSKKEIIYLFKVEERYIVWYLYFNGIATFVGLFDFKVIYLEERYYLNHSCRMNGSCLSQEY